LLNPAAAANRQSQGEGLTAAERATQIGGVQVHGGVYTNPYALEPSIRVAALLGMAKRPSLARGLLSKS